MPNTRSHNFLHSANVFQATGAQNPQAFPVRVTTYTIVRLRKEITAPRRLVVAPLLRLPLAAPAISPRKIVIPDLIIKVDREA